MSQSIAESVLSVSDFVGLLNQTLEFAYPSVTIVGELSSFRVSKNRWVYFDLKDELASVKFFGTVYQLPGPLEDGMLLQVRGVPRLHPQFGFSVTVQAMQPVGEGSLKRAATLLEAKLGAEGLFDPARKRSLPYPPSRIGLITSAQSAAYADFIKIMQERWGGVAIELADVQVQGEAAVSQIVQAIEWFNTQADLPEVLVLTRGGGSLDDLAVFNTEQVTRAIAASRIPTLVAIGHEVDISLAELAADQRASTPSNAAQLLVPDKASALQEFTLAQRGLTNNVEKTIRTQKEVFRGLAVELDEMITAALQQSKQRLQTTAQLLELLNPKAILARGYAVVRSGAKTIRSVKVLKSGQNISLEFADGAAEATIK